MNPLTYQLYLLQIEDYKIFRFWNLLFKKGFYFSRQPLRKKLVWTNKVLLIATLSIFLLALISYLSFQAGIIIGIISIVVSLFLWPIYCTVSLILIWPVDSILKQIIIGKARKLVETADDLKIIGIAGSYGKTTLRNLMVSVLKEKYKVLSPEGNLNTAVGISSWANKKKINDADILIIEFGEEYPGDNKKIAGIFPPNFVIITGINEAHFERIGSIEKTAETIFESVSFAKSGAKVFINKEDKNAMEFYKKYVGEKEVELYDSSSAKEIIFNQEELIQSAEIEKIGKVKTKILGDYIFADIDTVIKIAQELEIPDKEIKAGIEKMDPIEHRLQPIKGAGDVLVIDDSYNGNPAGVKSAIKLLGSFTDKRKIYLTPGLVETGEKNKEVHEQIGRELAKVANKVILVKNSATDFIAHGLKNGSFKEGDIIWFNSAPEAHKSLGSILKPKDVILFQNDWGDQYI